MTIGDLRRLKSLLRPAVNAGNDGQEGDAFNEICRLLFGEDSYLSLWDEEVLTQSARLFKTKTPNQKVYGKQLALLQKRTEIVTKANDLYFCLLSSKCTADDIVDRLSQLSNNMGNLVIDYARIEEIRASRSCTSEKLEAFYEYLTMGLELRFGEADEALKQIVELSKMQTASGKVNALLLNRTQGYGVVVPLSVKLTPGSGTVQCLVPSDNEFRKAVERARLSAVAGMFLPDSEDVHFSLETTSAEYSGGSIGLAAVAAIYSAAQDEHIDQYTAFTGDINLHGSIYQVFPVDAIDDKLSAALQCGCRRIFIPRANQTDVDPGLLQHLHVEYVDDLTDLILKLSPSVQTVPGNTAYIRKINFLRKHCRDRGWDLSEPVSIQDGQQFVISPIHPPDFKLNIYYTGSHTPKISDKVDFQSLLAGMEEIDQPKVPIQSVNQTFLIKDSQLKTHLRDQFSKLNPETRSEQYCDYVLQLETRKENLAIKQYSSGKLLIQGHAGDLYKRLLDIIIPLYNLKYPNAQLSVDNYIKHDIPKEVAPQRLAKALDECIDFPYIGTDESGKGDYFGPLVVAGVWVNESINEKLKLLDVKDSKLLSDKRCRELARKIREICIGRFEEIELLPKRYNELYEQFRKEGKNLNHLLAWGHARTIETILSKIPCPRAVADQFGDERYILSKLMEKGKRVQLIQTPKAERFVAVAAASVLARDRFLARMDKLGQKYQTVLPKGASDSVIDVARLIVQSAGLDELGNIAKLHHKTTQKVIGDKT
jgi:ribonuclease HIII